MKKWKEEKRRSEKRKYHRTSSTSKMSSSWSSSSSCSSWSWWSLLHFYVVPTSFVLLLPLLSQVLVRLGTDSLSIILSPSILSPGSKLSWLMVVVVAVWSYVWQRFSYTKVAGPPSFVNGFVPRYAMNGHVFFVVSMLVYVALSTFVFPNLPIVVYSEFGNIVSTLNIVGLGLSFYLLVTGLNSEEAEDALNKPLVYNFYRGVIVHHCIAGVDVKQLVIARFGMIAWAILTLSFTQANVSNNGWTVGPWVHCLLLEAYLYKFFYWGAGYFASLDFIYDRPGFYLCWGAICWVQVFYAFVPFVMVTYPCSMSLPSGILCLVTGLVFLALNYAADLQKERFRRNNGKGTFWGRPFTFLEVSYRDHSGKVRKNRLLTSGFWGCARHLNYTFEILLAFVWTLPALCNGILAFGYPIFLVGLLVHRTYRDDDKCRAKYGKGWDEYCKLVPHRLIPYVY